MRDTAEEFGSDGAGPIEAERLFAEPLRIDQAINRLEARNDTAH